jgi:RNA polymerase sigma-70 factor (ECF subfamily)
MSREPRSDDELVRRIQEDRHGPAGRAAAEELFGRYHGKVYRWCLHRVGDPDRAYDAAQDVVLSAWRALPRFRGQSRFSTWLFVIMRNRCLRVVRPASLVRDEGEEPELMADPAPGPDQRSADRGEEERVLTLMRAHLAPREQLALWLRCYEGMSVEEITRAMTLPGVSGARSVLQSARRKLRAAIEGSPSAQSEVGP